jgi:hypothetical protein
MDAVLLIVFVVCMMLSFMGTPFAPEPYRQYGFVPLVVAVLCLGLRVFGHI